MVYDASFWREQRNWSALTGALTGAATRHDYLGMLRHIEAVRAAGMPEERIRRVYAEVRAMVPTVPAFEMLEHVATGRAPAPEPKVAHAPPTISSAAESGGPAVASEPAAPSGSTANGTPLVAEAPAGAPATEAGPSEPGGRGTVQQLDYWLSVLRTGDDSQKIEARNNLAVIFEQRGLVAEAIEMLEGNAWAGVRDATTQRRLAALYRQIGRQDLADKAISDLYQLGMSGPATSAPPSAMPGATLAGPHETVSVSAAPTTTTPAPAEPPAEAPVQAPAWRRPRPLWLSISLMVATFGLYGYYWLFATWRELKHETGNERMHPFWHTFGIAIVPIYGWLRFFDHVRTIRRLGVAAGTGTTLSPGLCVWLFIITAVVNRLTVRVEPWTPTPPWLDLLVLIVDTVLVAWPQAALTGLWERLPGGAAPFRVHGFEWLLLIVGGLLWAAILAGLGPP